MSDNPYPNASDTMHYELHTAWDEGYAEGFAAGRAAATPDPPLHGTGYCPQPCPECASIPAPASPDERLREAGDRLAQAVARVCGEGHPALGMWRVALGTDARGKPDGASVPDQTRRIVVYDARCGRGGLDVPVGCTVGEAALLAAEMFGVRVGPNDRPSFGLRGTGLHASDPLPDDEDYELFVIGGTV